MTKFGQSGAIQSHVSDPNTNDNSQRMIEFCEATDLRTKCWKLKTNCRAYNTIDIGSDHRIVSANLSLSLRANKQTPNGRCQYNWAKLSDPSIQRKFDMELRNRFNTLMDETTASNNVSEL